MMFTRIIIHSMALFILLGCGFMFDGGDGDKDNSKVSKEIKSFAVEVTNDDSMEIIMKSVKFSDKSSDYSKTKRYQKEHIESCPDGGTRSVDSNPQEMLNGRYQIDMIADNCIEDGIKSNFTISMKIEDKDNDLEVTTMIFTNDATFEDLNTTIVTTLFKDSTLIMDELSSNEELTTKSLKLSTSTGKKYEYINLISHDKFEDNNDSSYKISGQIINSGIVYSIDKAYDSSKTPMVSIYKENKEFLVSGISKYYNEQHQHITVEVIEKDTIKISIDRDNDGKNEAVDVVKIKSFNP